MDDNIADDSERNVDENSEAEIIELGRAQSAAKRLQIVQQRNEFSDPHSSRKKWALFLLGILTVLDISSMICTTASLAQLDPVQTSNEEKRNFTVEEEKKENGVEKSEEHR